MVKFEHFIITAFNVDFNLKPRELILGVDYLKKRFELFEKICLPSVVRQSCKNFKWLVFFDSDTPTQFKNRIEEFSKNEIFIPVYTEPQVSSDIWRVTVQQYLSQDTRFVITSNLDNDDAIGQQFIALVQNNFNQQDFEFINFPFGYMLREDGLFLREYLSSPFLSLIERTDDVLTCKCVPHHVLYKLSNQGISVRQVLAKPSWLQIIHDTNVINSFDINSVIQPLNKLNKYFVIENIPAKYLQSNYLNNCSHFLSRLRKSKRIPLGRKIRNIVTMISPSISLTYLWFSLGIRRIVSNPSQLSALEAKRICKKMGSS